MVETITISDSSDEEIDIIRINEPASEAASEPDDNWSDIEVVETIHEQVFKSSTAREAELIAKSNGKKKASDVDEEMRNERRPKAATSRPYNPLTLPLRNPPRDLFNGGGVKENVIKELAPTTGGWNWSLEAINYDKSNLNGKGKGKMSDEEHNWHCTSFFPYAHLPGLEYMKDVAAIVGGTQIELIRPSDLHQTPNGNAQASGSNSRSRIDHLGRVSSPSSKGDPELLEDYYTCSWSVNIDKSPFIPILAVAGRSTVIEIFHIFSDTQERDQLNILHERTIPGHGGPIYHLTFSLSHPHFLASASDDGGIRLWSSQLPAGSNSYMLNVINDKFKLANSKKIKKSHKSLKNKAVVERDLARGEMVAVLGDKGHNGGSLSVDIHPILPLIVSSGRDSTIKICLFPASIRGPTWPHLQDSSISSEETESIKTPKILYPLFTSSAIHNGQWVDQVSWSNSFDCSIISKSTTSYSVPLILDLDELSISRTSPSPSISPTPFRKPCTTTIQKSIKIWTPSILNTLSPSTLNSINCWYKLREEAKLRREQHGLQDSLNFNSFPTENSLDFRNELEMRIDGDENWIGDTIGILKKKMKLMFIDEEFKEDRIEETSLFVPNFSSSTIEIYRPFTSSSIINPSLPYEAKPEVAEALFPLDNKREKDFIPEVLPSRILNLKQEDKIHFRSLGIEPENGKWLLGVGDKGAIACWRRRKEGKD